MRDIALTVVALLLVSCQLAVPTNELLAPDGAPAENTHLGTLAWGDEVDGWPDAGADEIEQGSWCGVVCVDVPYSCPAAQTCMPGPSDTLTCQHLDGALSVTTDAELHTCPPDSGWPCSCTSLGGQCADGTPCVKLWFDGPGESIGVCRYPCETDADCPGDLASSPPIQCLPY